MVVVVPSSEAQIDPAQESNGLIDNNKLLVMGPEQDPSGSVIWMPEYLNLWMCRTQQLFAVHAVDHQSQLHFLVQQDKHTNTFLLRKKTQHIQINNQSLINGSTTVDTYTNYAFSFFLNQYSTFQMTPSFSEWPI